MNYKEAKQAISDAETTIKMADIMVNDIIKILPGRLRKVSGYWPEECLCDIKKELKNFNMKTRQWKS